MKLTLILTVILFFMLISFPLLTLIDTDTDTSAETSATLQEETEKAKSKETVEVFSSKSNKTKEMSLEDYLFFTVSAEMPASFHEEALKAQAVASYTYLKWIQENADKPSEFTADITSDSSKHQATATEDELQEKWGSSYDIYSEKIKNAVKSVLYEYLSYKNETAMTVYHAISSGNTLSAEKVWGSAIPYLCAVTAPGDKLSPDYSSRVKISESEFLSVFKNANTTDTEAIIKGAKKNSEDFIKEISFGDTVLSYNDLRSEFSLGSPCFKVKKEKQSIIFTVYGKGHGVGMSQNSADYMARQGYTYKEILLHFYKDTAIVKEK